MRSFSHIYIPHHIPHNGIGISPFLSLNKQADPIEEFSGINSPASGKTDTSSVDEDASSVSSFDMAEGRRPTVAVIGVGYIGEHLVEVFSSQYAVVGYDVSPRRIEHLKQTHLSPGPGRMITFTTSESDLQSASYFLVSVPTLLHANGEINLAHLCSAIDTISRNARAGSTVVIESTVTIGMTRALLGPLALAQGLFVGMSPERVDPGRVSPPRSPFPSWSRALSPIRPPWHRWSSAARAPPAPDRVMTRLPTEIGSACGVLPSLRSRAQLHTL